MRVAGRGAGGTGVLAGFLVAGCRLLVLEEERGGGGHPGVAQDLIQVDPILGSDPQAGPDKVLAFLGERPPEPDVGVADLLVLLEGNVAADHVEEEDAERPDGGRVPVVPAAADPLGGSVHAGACKMKIRKLGQNNKKKFTSALPIGRFYILYFLPQLTVKVGVGSVLHEGARAKVDELELAGPHVDQEVLVLDVAVDDALPVAGDHRLHDLPEVGARHLLLERALFRDVVKQVLAVGGALHHVDERVLLLVKVYDPDDARHRLHRMEKLQLERNPPSVQLEKKRTRFVKIVSFSSRIFRQKKKLKGKV